jgi:hypothetical protein
MISIDHLHVSTPECHPQGFYQNKGIQFQHANPGTLKYLKVCHSNFLTHPQSYVHLMLLIVSGLTPNCSRKLWDKIDVCRAQCRKISSFLHTSCLLLLFTTVNIYYCLLHPLLVLHFPRILEGNDIYCYEREVQPCYATIYAG